MNIIKVIAQKMSSSHNLYNEVDIQIDFPSPSEDMVPFFVNEIFPFKETEADDNASKYIKSFYGRSE